MRWRICTRYGSGTIGMAGNAEDRDEKVVSPSGVPVPAEAMATCEQLVALLRFACQDLPMEAEPGDFLVSLERNASQDKQ